MLELLALAAAAQVETVRLPPPATPPGQVATLKVAPDLIVKEIRIQDDSRMHVLVANTGTGPVGDYFPVRASVELAGQAYDVPPTYAKPLAAGEEAWVTFDKVGLSLTKAASATAAADQYPEPKPRSWLSLWPSPTGSYEAWLRTMFPAMKAPCKEVKGCITEINESNNSFTVAGVPRGTPERLNAPELAPERLPERGFR